MEPHSREVHEASVLMTEATSLIILESGTEGDLHIEVV